ncbi:MAG: RagB/SusD family nutrient uptake outer membrane protein, partial [Odoribacter sp.]|nr:RagB/SusD family nutrient uptake outer membrane protein [Odoribacter sp.]
YIPYFENYPSIYEPDKSVSEVLSLVERDLLLARELIAPFDTLSGKSMLHPDKRIKNEYISNSVTDLFFLFRGYRMNYYAVTGLLARVYNYMGEHEKAARCAEEVTGAYIEEFFINCFPLTEAAKVKGNDRKRYGEVIFALSNTKNVDNYQPYYTTGNDRLYLADYPACFDDNSDVRKTVLTEALGAERVCNKYILPVNNALVYTSTEDVIPMLRVSEMYYIQAEYLCRNGKFQEAVEKLDMVRAARDCTKGRLTISGIDEFEEELLKEARREFMQEGQLYFYFKRLNVKPLNTMPDGAFVLPLPDNELIN